MWSVTAVRPCDDVAAEAGGAARTAMARRAAVGEPRADRSVGVDVPEAVAGRRTDAVEPGEFPLKELTPAADRAKRIEGDDVGRRVPIGAAPALAHLAGIGRTNQRPRNAFVGDVRRFVLVHELAGHGH